MYTYIHTYVHNICFFFNISFLMFKKENVWRRKWQPTPVFLPGKIHRQRSLAG